MRNVIDDDKKEKNAGNPVVQFPDTKQDTNKMLQKEKSGHMIPEKVSPEDLCELTRKNDALQQDQSHNGKIKNCSGQGLEKDKK